MLLQVSQLLGCPTWTGGGPGLMQGASQGAAAAGGVVAGIRLQREAGTTVLSGTYLPEDAQVRECRMRCVVLQARLVER
jgi:predicted Rossmann-fold nucleotide-binding protein